MSKLRDEITAVLVDADEPMLCSEIAAAIDAEDAMEVNAELRSMQQDKLVAVTFNEEQRRLYELVRTQAAAKTDDGEDTAAQPPKAFSDLSYDEIRERVLAAIDDHHCTRPQIKRHAGFEPKDDLDPVIEGMVGADIDRLSNDTLTIFVRKGFSPTRFWNEGDRIAFEMANGNGDAEKQRLIEEKNRELEAERERQRMAEESAAEKVRHLQEAARESAPLGVSSNGNGHKAGRKRYLNYTLQELEDAVAATGTIAGAARKLGYVNAASLHTACTRHEDKRDAVDRGKKRFKLAGGKVKRAAPWKGEDATYGDNAASEPETPQLETSTSPESAPVNMDVVRAATEDGEQPPAEVNNIDDTERSLPPPSPAEQYLLDHGYEISGYAEQNGKTIRLFRRDPDVSADIFDNGLQDFKDRTSVHGEVVEQLVDELAEELVDALSETMEEIGQEEATKPRTTHVQHIDFEKGSQLMIAFDGNYFDLDEYEREFLALISDLFQTYPDSLRFLKNLEVEEPNLRQRIGRWLSGQ